MSKVDVEVEFTGLFREICKRNSCSLKVNGSLTLSALVGRIGELLGISFKEKLGVDKGKHDEESFIVIVNGRVVQGANFNKTSIKPGDHVIFGPSLVGGG